MEVNDKIKRLRLGKNISQYELAKQLKISRSVIAKWETGLSTPKDNMLLELAEFFNVDVKYFEDVSNMSLKKCRIKRIIFIISLCFLFSLLISTAIVFYPKKISYFIKNETTEIQRFEIIYFENRYEIDVNKEYEIIEKIMNVKVTPLITFNRKVTTPYEIILYFEDDFYRIKGNRIVSSNNVRYYNDKNDYLYSIIEMYLGGKND